MVKQEISLPTIKDNESLLLNEIISALGINREDILASDKDINKVYQELCEILNIIPQEYLNPTLAKMCIAIRVGLFDSTLNYIWNTTVINLREKLKNFWLNHIIFPQIKI
ncbi:MAG: hypothetical protein LBH40_00385 [Alphaproteobacteria bacterium]|jgi:hypothetical protein|nr:hypothetical protein [Alphaproteobacteria bacterium]